MSARAMCAAAPAWRDSHQVGSRPYHLTTPDGALYDFCSACCLLSFAVYGLPADGADGGDTAGTTTEAPLAGPLWVGNGVRPATRRSA